MLSVEEALRRVLAQTPVLPPTRLPFRQSLGRVLAEAVVAPFAIPPFHAAAVDGYAVAAAGGTAKRRLVGDQFAGHVTDLKVTLDTAVRVTTGAPVPPGADAVVMVEVAEEHGGQLTIGEPVSPGDGVRPLGTDVQAGQEVLPAGAIVGPAEMGLIASLGMTEVAVYPAARVAVLSTGDEVIEPGRPLAPGQIYDANRFTLIASLREIGAEPLDLGIAGDQQDALEKGVEWALAEADALLVSGAVSMGNLDLLKPLLAARGNLFVGRVKMKPGKPLTFATIRGKPIFALPGNPVSSLMTFELFARPAIMKMQGHRALARPSIGVRLAHSIRHRPDRREFQRAVASWRDGEYWATTTGNQVSSRLLSLVGANVLLELPENREDFAEGERVKALVIGDLEQTWNV